MFPYGHTMSGDGIWGRCNMETNLNFSSGEQLEDPELKAEYDAPDAAYAVRDKVKALECLQELFGSLAGDVDWDKVREERLKI